MTSWWLLKNEPEPHVINGIDVSLSIDALAKAGTADWFGVRNYAARNNLQAMRVGDRAFYYHSSCKVPGVVGICEVIREAYPDETAWNPKHPFFDAKSSPSEPRWFKVDVKFIRKFDRIITLTELRAQPALAAMQLLTMGRLSVSRVTREQWDHICAMETEAVIPAPVPAAVAVPAPNKIDAAERAAFRRFVSEWRPKLRDAATTDRDRTAKALTAALASKWDSMSDDERRSYVVVVTNKRRSTK